MSTPAMTRRRSVAILAVMLASACLVGADFGRPDPETLVLGKTTEKEIRDRFGEPSSQSTAQVKDKVVTVVRYTQIEPRPAVVLGRTLVYSFYQDKLVGFDYSSSFENDKTDFDETLPGRIKRGETTLRQVLALLGRPTGQFIYPSPYVWAQDQRAFVYSYSRNDRPPPGGTLQTINKFLAITFDSHDVVAETSLSTTVTSRPSR